MRSDYLAFGNAGARLDTAGALQYLVDQGFDGGMLGKARAGVDEHASAPFEFEALGANYCDFCFVRLMGGEYDRLADGRERCVRCSSSVIRTSEEFAELFSTTRQTLEMAFGTSINVAMRIEMVNAAEIARRTGETFVATPGVDARVLGFASSSADGFSLHIENGSPALAAISTIAHELTHIWQFSNWEPGMVETRYGKENELIVGEGMATWAQVQYLLCIKEFEYADRQEAYAEGREDAYGVGFKMFRDRYPLARNGEIGLRSPFHAPFPL